MNDNTTITNNTNIPCCGADLTFPDLSLVENPKNPKDTISEEFLKQFEEDFKDFDIGYVNGLEGLFLHDYEFDYTSAIVISHEMYDYILEAEIGAEAEKANNDLYENFGTITYFISDYLRENGFETYVAHPREEKINFSKIAEKTNMGSIGKGGLFISPRFGPKQKMSAILVNIKNLPVTYENPHSWIREYCEYCNSCIRKCPKKALSYTEENKQMSIDENLCIGCSEGCTECIKSCPFYQKGYGKVYEKFKKIQKRRKKD
ncbi:hypothetical protein [Methanobrevibacter sp.]